MPVLRRGDPMYICADPGCSSMRPRAEINGKNCKCILCGDTYIMNYDQLRRVKPVCDKCSDTKLGRIKREADQILFDLLKSSVVPTVEEELAKGWEDPPDESERYETE